MNPANSETRPDISPSAFRSCLLWLAVLGLVTRAGYLVEHAGTPAFAAPALDEKYYVTVSKMLLAGESLRPLNGLRPLLYPMFLAVCEKLGGAHGLDLAIIAQHGLGIATGLLVALLGARMFQHRLSGIAGGTLYLLAPVPLCFEGELLIESSYTFLICLGLWLVFRALETDAAKSGPLWLQSGALTALIAQARANILVFTAIYPLLALGRWRRARTAAALVPMLGLVGALLMAGAWGFVNETQTDHFHFIPTAGGVNFYMGNKRSADGMVPMQERRATYSDERYEDSSEIWAEQEYRAALRAEGRKPDKDPMAVSRYWMSRGLAEIRADPAHWLKLMARKCWLTLWNTEVPNNKSFAFMQMEYAWLRALPVRWVVLLMLAPMGVWAAFKSGNRGQLLTLLGYAILYSAANVFFFICDRYRYPIWPAMAVLAGGGLFAVIESLRQRAMARTLGFLSIMGLMAAVSLPNWFGVRLPTFARDYLFRSMAWYDEKHYPEALDDVQRSIALDPNDVTALHQLGNVSLALHHLPEARQAYEQALQRSPNEAVIWNNLGVTDELLGHTNAALKDFQRAMAIDPPSDNAFLDMALLEIRLNRPGEAAAALDQFDRHHPPPDAVALELRSVLAQRRGELEQAAKLDKQARKLDTEAADWALKKAVK